MCCCHDGPERLGNARLDAVSLVNDKQRRRCRRCSKRLLVVFAEVRAKEDGLAAALALRARALQHLLVLFLPHALTALLYEGSHGRQSYRLGAVVASPE